MSRNMNRASRGMMLAELLISVAIIAMLLTCMGGVMMSVAQSVRINDNFTRASQAARMAMTRMTRDVRTSDACQVGTSLQQAASRITDSRLEIVTIDGQTSDYQFDAEARTLTLSVDGSDPVILVRDVEGSFSSTVVDAGDGARQTMTVVISLTVKAGTQNVYLSGSASPRRSMS